MKWQKEKTNICSGGGVPSKPIWKKWWFWTIVVVVLVSGVNTFTNNSSTESEQPKQETTEKQTAEENREPETEKPTEPVKETVETDEESAMVKETHIYDNATEKPVMNGSRTDEIGKYSIIEIDSSLATEENLADWYFNYIVNNDFNWCMILYTDKDNDKGVYAIEGMVEKDVMFNKDEFGDYSLGDSSQSIILAPTDERTLKKIK